jgi:uncharacterized membrane protein YfcA
MNDIIGLLVIAATFLLAGSVKGIIGLGLPTISLGILAATFDLTTAMALLLIPSFITNIWQAAVGGNAGIILRRLWPFLCLATIAIWLGSTALVLIKPLYLSLLLGILLLVYGMVGLLGFRLSISPRNEKWAGPVLGLVNGIFTGMTGSFVVPGVMYLQAIGLPRDMLVQAMGILFSLSTIGLALVLQKHNILTQELVWVSFFGVIPALLGMVLGQKIRSTLSEKKFKKVFFIAIFILGLLIIGKSVTA